MKAAACIFRGGHQWATSPSRDRTAIVGHCIVCDRDHSWEIGKPATRAVWLRRDVRVKMPEVEGREYGRSILRNGGALVEEATATRTRRKIRFRGGGSLTIEF